MCKSPQSLSPSTLSREEHINPSLQQLSVLYRRFPEPHFKPLLFPSINSASGMASWRRWGFELGLKAGWTQRSRVGKGALGWEDDHRQSAEMQNKECLDAEVSGKFQFILKRLSGRGTFLTPMAFCFSKCLKDFLVLIIQSLKMNQRTHKLLPYP